MSLVFWGAGCTDAREARDDGAAATLGSLDDGDAGVDGGEDDDDDTGPSLDALGGDGDGDDGPGPEGGVDACKKIDFLFVVDNSGSMQDEQQNLTSSFPGFIDTIQNATDTVDFHVMVVDSDTYRAPGEGIGGECSDGSLDCCPMVCAQYPYAVCGGVPCSPNPPPPPSNCDQMLGAGKDDNGFFSCGLPAGQRYIDASVGDISGASQCAASVGIQGQGDEQVMEAMPEAIGPMTQPGACNEGFLRDDAVLVVTIITDEEDDQETASTACDGEPQSGSQGGPMAWVQSVLDAKNGVNENVVVLSLIGPDQAAPACPALDKCNGGLTGAEPSPRIEQFTSAFTHGLVGQVCAPSYDQFFADAVGLVTQACEEFVPPG